MFVTTETSLTAVPTPRSRIPPRAVSVTATCTRGSASTRPAPPGPDQSPVSTSSPSMKMPSVDDQPGIRPPALTRWAISRVVVVLPLVPVTAITGIAGRSGATVSPGSWPAMLPDPVRLERRGRVRPGGDGAEPSATAAPNSSAVSGAGTGRPPPPCRRRPGGHRGHPGAQPTGAADHGRGQQQR